MSPEIKEKLRKVYELVNSGIDGEREAAMNVLEQLMAKFGITEAQLSSLDQNEYEFGYTSKMELILLARVMETLYPGVVGKSKRIVSVKKIISTLDYTTFINIECAYEYFRRHMKAQWILLCIPELAKCRKTKTKNKLRAELQDAFISKYLIESKLVPESSIKQVPIKSGRHLNRVALVSGVQGGQYNKQIHTNKLLE